MQLSTISLALTRLGGLFSPAALFAGGTAGAWYDPSDLSTMFTTSAGTTPVAMPGQGSAVSVGLMLDKSQGLVLGSELVTNGGPGFTATTGWAASGATVNASGGKLVCAVTSAGPSVYWTLTTVIGTWYQVNIVWENVNATNPSILVNSTGGLSITTTNTNATVYFCAVATSTFVQMLLGNGAPGTSTRITSLSAKTIAGNHAIAFNNTTARPELRARVNLLTYSEEFDNGAWLKVFLNTTGTPAWINAAVAPNGTTTADLLLDNTTSAEHYAQQSFSCISGVSYTFSGYVKQYTYTTCIIRTWLTGSIVHSVDFSAGTISGGGTLISVGNGWYRFEITRTASATGTAYIESYVKQTGSYVGTGTDGHYVWGFDVRPANIGANVPAYQRIADANTYDTSGFPLYLRFDGIDDSMYTPANLNLSGTDKVSVFAGVRKLSDAAAGMLVELSAEANSNNGAFAVAAPGWSSPVASQYGSALRATVALEFANSPASFAAPITNVLTDQFTTTGATRADRNLLSVNGVAQALTFVNNTTAGGNFGTYPLYIGARNNGSIWLNGHLHSLIIAGSAVSAGNISATEQWVAGKTGITI